MALHGPKLLAVNEQNLNQVALRLNGFALFDDEQGHKTIGSHEDYSE
jgi:hypothetical protein